MNDAKADAALYVLTMLLQRLETTTPGLLDELIDGVEGDLAATPDELLNAAHVDAVFSETLSMLRRARGVSNPA